MFYRQLNADYSAIEFADFFESVSMRLIALGFAELGYYRIRKRGQRRSNRGNNKQANESRERSTPGDAAKQEHKASQMGGVVRGGSRAGAQLASNNDTSYYSVEYEETSSSATDEVSVDCTSLLISS